MVTQISFGASACVQNVLAYKYIPLMDTEVASANVQNVLACKYNIIRSEEMNQFEIDDSGGTVAKFI